MSYQNKFIVPSVKDNVLQDILRKTHLEFKSIQDALKTLSSGGTTVISVSGGSSGSVSTSNGTFVATAVTAGTPTITFSDVGTVTYGAYGFVLKSNGDIGLAIPQIPPLTDSRGTNSVKVQVFDTGTLYLFILHA